jgi:hypothetical protein
MEVRGELHTLAASLRKNNKKFLRGISDDTYHDAYISQLNPLEYFL